MTDFKDAAYPGHLPSLAWGAAISAHAVRSKADLSPRKMADVICQKKSTSGFVGWPLRAADASQTSRLLTCLGDEMAVEHHLCSLVVPIVL